MPSPQDRADALAGRVLEAVTRRLHARRLPAAARAPADGCAPWAPGPPSARDGNDVRVLVDGADGLRAMMEALRAARSNVRLLAWALTLDLELVPGDPSSTVGSVLATAATRADVRVLLWAGAPLGRPWAGSNRLAVARLRRAGVDAHAARSGALLGAVHEKVLVVDDDLAFVGSMDMTDVLGDRRDSSAHPPRRPSGWHDLTAAVRGPAVADVARHFNERWHAVTGVRLPSAAEPAAAGPARVQVVRTVPARAPGAPAGGDHGALRAHLAMIRAARRLIHIESQFLWSVEIVDALADKLRAPPHDRFRVVAVLPLQPRKGIDATRGQLRRLVEADAGAGRLVACSLRAREGDRHTPIYVHAKATVVDDTWLTVGSANLSDHSFFTCTELQLVVDDATLARTLRERLWAEHLETEAAALAGADPTDVVDGVWRPTADEQLGRVLAGRPPTARVVALRPASRRSARAAGALQTLVLGA